MNPTTARPIPPENLIPEAREGDDAAQGRLLEGFRQYLLLVANRELPNDLRPKVAASDLVQETFLRAHRHFGSFKGHSSDELRAWLHCILVNYLANVDRDFRHTTKRDLSREVPGDELYRRGLEDCLSHRGNSPSGEILAGEADTQLHRALAQLPEEYRRVITWRNYEMLSFAMIGNRLHRSAEAARKLWNRAVRRLGELLDHGHDR